MQYVGVAGKNLKLSLEELQLTKPSEVATEGRWVKFEPKAEEFVHQL